MLAIGVDAGARARARGRDVSNNPVENLLATGDEPLRCCLRNARAGEALILFGYAPPLGPSPYREIGAVFAHAEACDGPASRSHYPPAWRGRRQVLRAYDRRSWIRDAVVHDGSDPEECSHASSLIRKWCRCTSGMSLTGASCLW